jgi:hypothetical protein
MKVLSIIAAGVGTLLGRSLGCDKILFDAAYDRWGPDLGQAIKGMHLQVNAILGVTRTSPSLLALDGSRSTS